MVAALLSPEQLAGINDKLDRADESIRDLNVKIAAFLKECRKRGSGDDWQKVTKELIDSHQVIPPRFGVMAGEITHHLRSVFDHLIWMLSSDTYRRSNERAITFPVCTEKPASKDKISRYRRKIKGVDSSAARDLIERLQPHNAANPMDDPLFILNEFDREDKHHTLILIVSLWNLRATLPTKFTTFVISGFDEKREWMDAVAAPKPELQFSPYIAFAQVGRWKGEAVIPTLTHLLNTVRDDVRMFSELTI